MKFEEILRQYNVPVAPTNHHHARMGWVQFDCPFCGKGNRKYHMGYRTSAGYVNCWRCGRHPLGAVLVAACGLAPNAAKALLAGLERPRTALTRPTGTMRPPAGVGPLGPAHRRYLTSRGYDPDRLIALWGIGGIGLHAPRLRWRVYIPIHYNDTPVSWTTRSIAPAHRLRYVSAKAQEESMNHKELLYGEEYARYAVIVHEGPTDVWATGPGAVAVLGTAYCRAQVAKIARYPRRYICFDNQPDAQKRAKRLCDDLCAFTGVTENVVLDAKDASTALLENPDELRELRSLLE
jgi:hypothetical protein